MVADDRKEDTDFNYWLQVVELLSDGSPLLLIQNDKQDRRRDLDLKRLRACFHNLEGSFRTNLADNRGVEEIRKAVRKHLESLPLVGTPLPRTWKRVRAALEDDSRNYVSVEEYREICRGQGFERVGDMLQLAGYLHDLGVCLHFQDDQLLGKTVLLNPKWAVDAVYRVLDDREVVENQGRFTRQDLARVWHEPEYEPVRGELLQLIDAAELVRDLLPDALRVRHREIGAPGLEVETPVEPETLKEVFISYAWGGESDRIVDKLEKAFEGEEVTLIRDRSEMAYRDSIREFMERIGRGKCVIVVLSDEYLKSDNCMFELVEIARREEMRSRIFPIVLEDARVYDAVSRLRYVQHWMGKKKELEALIQEVGSENLPTTREDIDLYARIRTTLDGIMGILKDMNALTPEIHRGSNFESLIDGVRARLSE